MTANRVIRMLVIVAVTVALAVVAYRVFDSVTAGVVVGVGGTVASVLSLLAPPGPSFTGIRSRVRLGKVEDASVVGVDDTSGVTRPIDSEVRTKDVKGKTVTGVKVGPPPKD